MFDERFQTAIILAGGQSRRMGYDKYDLEIGGSRLLDRMILQLSEAFDQIIVSVNTDNIRLPAGVEQVCDELPSRGPLAGIHAGLKRSNSLYTYVTACDMPNICRAYIDRLIGQIGDDSLSACCCRLAGRLEPFHAFYSKHLVPDIEARVLSGQNKVIDFLERVDAKVVDASSFPDTIEIKALFANINTPADLNACQNQNGETTR